MSAPVWHIWKLLNTDRGGKPTEVCGPRNPVSHAAWTEFRKGKWGTTCLLPLGNICAWQAKAETHRLISRSIKGGLQSLTDKFEEAIIWVSMQTSAQIFCSSRVMTSQSSRHGTLSTLLPLPGCPPPHKALLIHQVSGQLRPHSSDSTSLLASFT